MNHLRNDSFVIKFLYIQNFDIIPIKIVIVMYPMICNNGCR